MLESTTKLIMDDESTHKPDDIRSISARSHSEHLNNEEIEEIGSHRRHASGPYGDVAGSTAQFKREKVDDSNVKR